MLFNNPLLQSKRLNKTGDTIYKLGCGLIAMHLLTVDASGIYGLLGAIFFGIGIAVLVLHNVTDSKGPFVHLVIGTGMGCALVMQFNPQMLGFGNYTAENILTPVFYFLVCAMFSYIVFDSLAKDAIKAAHNTGEEAPQELS